MMEPAIEFVSTRLQSAIPEGLRVRRRRNNNNGDAADRRDDDANIDDTQEVEEQRRDDPERQWQPRRRSSLENECPICNEVLFPLHALAAMDAAVEPPLLPTPPWLRQSQQRQRQQAQQRQEPRHSLRNRRCGHRLCSMCHDGMRRAAAAAAEEEAPIASPPLECPLCRGAMDRLRDETAGRDLPVVLPELTPERALTHVAAFVALVLPVVLEMPSETLDWVFETGPLITVEPFVYVFTGMWGYALLVEFQEFSLFIKKLTATGLVVTLSVLYYMDWYGWVLRSICRSVVFVGFCVTLGGSLVGFYQGSERSLLWWKHDQTSTPLKTTMGVVMVGSVTYFQWWTHVLWFCIRVVAVFAVAMLLYFYNTHF